MRLDYRRLRLFAHPANLRIGSCAGVGDLSAGFPLRLSDGRGRIGAYAVEFTACFLRLVLGRLALCNALRLPLLGAGVCSTDLFGRRSELRGSVGTGFLDLVA